MAVARLQTGVCVGWGGVCAHSLTLAVDHAPMHDACHDAPPFLVHLERDALYTQQEEAGVSKYNIAHLIVHSNANN